MPKDPKKEIIETPNEIIPLDTPESIVAFGKTAANELISLVKQNGWSVNIQGKDFLKYEAWQTIGAFFKYTVKIIETKYVEYGQAHGFEAKAVIVDRSGIEIGAGEGIAMSDENFGRGKPLTAIKGMAQTRACGRAYRQILSWVVVLAGYSPTPSEEIEPASGQSFNSSTIRSGDSPSTNGQRILIKRLIEAGKLKMLSSGIDKLTLSEASALIKEYGN